MGWLQSSVLLSCTKNPPYSWRRGALGESWYRWRSCSWQLAPSSYRCHQQDAGGEEIVKLNFICWFLFFSTSERHQPKSQNTSGGFLKDLLTPAERFRPWATPLLGPMAPMVSSDDCRGLTGIPVTDLINISTVASGWLCGLHLTLPLSLSFTLSHMLTRS